VLAWVLNLDADLELAEERSYTPRAAVLRAVAESLPSARALLGPEDVLVDDVRARGRVGRAFCPTRNALAALVAAGVTPEPHPSHAVLRRVNDRAFCASLGQTMGGTFVRSVDEALAWLASRPPVGEAWRAKRAFGMAGRGQWRFRPGGASSSADFAFLRSAAPGGLQIEPDVSLVRELSRHGWLAPSGDLRLGRLVEQTCDAHGRWRSSRPAGDDVPGVTRELERVAEALHAAGYFGPFGVDAFFYRSGSAIELQPRSEINARYSMGFAVGFGRAPEVVESEGRAR